MSPAFFTSLAERLFAHRWRLFATTLLAVALLFASLSMVPPRLVFLVGALAGPAVAVPWALFCACVWFHPQRGNLQPQSQLVGQLPPLLQTGVRWYASVFLCLFFVFGAVVWPVLSVAWL